MTRIVDPILADIRWEGGRLTVRGYVELAKALAVHVVTSTPEWCAAVWADDDYAVSKAAVLLLTVAALAAILLIAPPLLQIRQLPAPASTVFVALMPQALSLTLPSAVVLAVTFAFRRVRLDSRLVRRTLIFSAIVFAATYGIMGWIMPEANQRFREATYLANGGRDAASLDRGPNETSWNGLRRQIQDLRRTTGGERAAARLEFNYQTRMAIAGAAVPLSLAALAICTVGFGRRRPVVTGVGVLIVYWVFMVLEQHQAKAAVLDADFPGVYLTAWMPDAVLLIVATATLLTRRFLPPPPARVSRGA